MTTIEPRSSWTLSRMTARLVLWRKRLTALGRFVGEFTVSSPFWVLAVAAFSLIPAVWASTRLEIRSSFSELLPESQPSVVQMRRVQHRVAGNSTLLVVAEGSEPESLREFVDVLSSRIRALGPELVSGVDSGGRPLQEFSRKNRLLYVELELLEEFRDQVSERFDYEVGKRAGFDLDIAGDEAPPPISPESLRERLAPAVGAQAPASHYVGEDGRLAVIVVRTPLEAGDPRTFELEQRIRDHARALDGGGSARIHFTGNLVTSAEEHRAVKVDLARVGVAGVSMILAVVWLFFLRLRAIIALAVTIAVGCLWSFGFAYVAVGHLNSATGFLVSIIAGDGINFGIILTARYLEARTRDAAPGPEAVSVAMFGTAGGTLTAALCAAVAYGSLAATDFRGFRHFGVIAGCGMVLCWLATYTVLPALLAAGERLAPLRGTAGRWGNRLRSLYGRPFTWVSRHASPWLLWLAAGSGLLCSGVALVYVVNDPLEYDMRRLRIDSSEPTSARRLARRVENLVSRLGRDGQAMVVERLEQVQPLVAELQRRRDRAPSDRKPFEEVVSVYDLLPQQQAEKLRVVAEVLELARRAQRLDGSAAGWSELTAELSALGPIGIDDLPADVAWPFEETDGTRGRIVYLVPARGESLNDARYLIRWANSFREVVLPDGDRIVGSGAAVIFADMLESVRADAPKAMLIALVATLVVILAAFGGLAAGWLAFASFVLGLSWLFAFLALTGERINFLNFVALPISVGIGADYAVNMMKRLEQEGSLRLSRVLEETGGAVVLCSLTTLFGYLALTFSENGAVRSFGRAAAVGEIAMLLSATLMIPAALAANRARK
ncbi:MAG TPA: MMPL family transporter [Polyangiaceae bacterium]